MDTKTPKIIISDENGSKELTGEELERFLIQKEKDSIEEENRKAAVEKDYNEKVAIRNQVISRLGLNDLEADILIAKIPKPLHLLEPLDA